MIYNITIISNNRLHFQSQLEKCHKIYNKDWNRVDSLFWVESIWTLGGQQSIGCQEQSCDDLGLL